MTRSVFFNILAVGIFALGVIFFIHYVQFDSPLSPISSPQVQLSAASVSQSTSTAATTATSSVATKKVTITSVLSSQKAPSKAKIATSTTPSDEVARIENPYSTAPESFDQINAQARAALVNILCGPQGSSSLNPISGSGVIIDPRGVILTNAHVAQYVLLSESPAVDLSCVIRTSSPAQNTWFATVLYIPPVWVNAHASDIEDAHPTGTGEHDYALLYITGSANGNPLPAQFPYLPADTRQAIAFPGDQVLIASYPAELIGAIGTEYGLYADSSVTTIKQLLTFAVGTPDLLSLGGVIEAQGGSSGGAVVNAWGRLVGLIATTSDGTTTAQRDLRAIALSYINTDIGAQSGLDLQTTLSGDPSLESQRFTHSVAPTLIQKYISILSAN